MTRVRVETIPFDQGRRKNDAFTHSTTLPTDLKLVPIIRFVFQGGFRIAWDSNPSGFGILKCPSLICSTLKMGMKGLGNSFSSTGF